MPSRHLQFVLACGMFCGLLGCKTPNTWFSQSPGGSTAPVVQYNGIQDSSATVSSSSQQGSSAWDSVSSFFGMGPKLDADIYIRAAHFAAQSGNYKEAESKYQQALKVEPKNADAYLGLARLYDQQGHSQQALATYQKAVKLHPRNASVYNDFGLCYSRRREYGPAQQMLQKAVEIEPTRANYRVNLATVLVDMGRPQDACQQLLAVQPEGVARYNLACLLEERGQQGQAADQLRMALGKDPSLAPAHELLAQLESAQPAVNNAAPQSQPNMQMVNATMQSRRDNRSMQVDPRDLQPPEINYGPAQAPANRSLPQDDAPEPQFPAQRTSYEDKVEDDKDAPITGTTVHLSDD